MSHYTAAVVRAFLDRKGDGLNYAWVQEGIALLTDEEYARFSQEVRLNRKNPVRAWVSWALGGVFGAHRFYLGHRTVGLVYLFTLGVLGCGFLADLFLLTDLLRSDALQAESNAVTSILGERLDATRHDQTR